MVWRMHGSVYSVACCPLSLLVVCTAIQSHPPSKTHTSDYIWDVLQFLTLRDKAIRIFGGSKDSFLLVSCKMDILLNTNLTQLIDKPTRITATSATLLDMVITNKPQSIIHSIQFRVMLVITN